MLTVLPTTAALVPGATMALGPSPWLAASTPTGWRPGIGDPTFWGWFTVAAYLAATVLGWIAARRAGHRPVDPARPRRERRGWFFLAAVMLALAINKQLDLQTWLTWTARAMAKSHGWYPFHRQLQLAFILAIAAAGAGLLTWLVWRNGAASPAFRLALVGLTVLGAFILIRASSFHHVDRLLGLSWGHLRLNHVLELGGIAIIIFAAAWRIRKSRPRPTMSTSRT